MTLRAVDVDLFDAVAALRVTESQTGWVAPVVTSLAQAATDPALTAWAVFDARERGMARPANPPVGFSLVEVRARVGFINRVLVDRAHQRIGYGRALLTELVRRLRLQPDVEIVAVSHRRDNTPMATLLRTASFIPWITPWPDPDPDEVYLHLPD